MARCNQASASGAQIAAGKTLVQKAGSFGALGETTNEMPNGERDSAIASDRPIAEEANRYMLRTLWQRPNIN